MALPEQRHPKTWVSRDRLTIRVCERPLLLSAGPEGQTCIIFEVSWHLCILLNNIPMYSETFRHISVLSSNMILRDIETQFCFNSQYVAQRISPVVSVVLLSHVA